METPTGKQVMLPRAARCKILQICPVEARGIEPRSRGPSMKASTCVACQFPMCIRRSHRVRYTGLRQAGSRDNYRPDFFSRNGRRGGLGGVPNAQVPTSPNCVRTGPSWAKLPERLTVKLRGSTAVQQLLFDRLFTWPADQPRHATKHFRSPVDARSPPVHPNYTLHTLGKKLDTPFCG